ncbi:efflux RND transporter periplasmic adaptor subunit [Marinicella rhabdoformis]|uniref:efflux RND transporter periplasmic adaptor subunit n=1 Tax=Marinicella rhabdoformis TaxID=2580566 RepID=UPI0012AEB8BF|nr:efflux RND transporter periplasmic adaptor subunit [Marinicella rhabdoformis]
MKKIVLLFSLAFSFNTNAKEVYATFTVYAQKSAKLAFNYTGVVKEINVDIMSVVKKGDVLATLISDDLIATNNATKVNLKYAKSELERYQDLYNKKLIDKSQLDKYKQAYESINAQIEIEKTIYDKTILRAPFDGVISQRMIESGDVVSGQTLKTAYQIQSQHDRMLVVQFDQMYNTQVKIGDVFKYKLDGDNRQYEGTIYRIYPEVNMENRKIAAQVLAKDLKVGLFGEGYIFTDSSLTETTVLE